MQAQDAKPPYVDFETRPVEDREASIKQGSYVTKDVNYALITPQGSKDKIEKVAEEWLADIEKAAREDRFPMQWVAAYKSAYQQYMEGLEIPLDGTPILGWQLASPSQQKNIITANIRTVEDLAAANEQALVAIGMGARMLKERAVSWLATATDTGKVAAENEALRHKTTKLETDLEAATESLKVLTAKVEALQREDA